MAQPSVLIKNLLDTTREEYFYHSTRVKQLKHKDYQFPCCMELLDKLSEIDEAIMHELDKIETLSQARKNDVDADSLKETLIKLQRYGQLIGILHYLLTFFELGSREYIQEGTAVPIKNLIKEFDKTASFVLVPIFEYNYVYLDLMRLLRRALSHALPDFDNIFAGIPEKYAVFGFPLIMKRNIILNAILSHELGHFIDEATQLSDRILNKVALDKKKIDSIAKKMEKSRFGEREIALTYFITPETLRAQITKLAAKQISEWLKELISDDIAFHLFGPIFLHSLSSFLIILVELDEASSDHPPPRMRIKMLLEEFNAKEYPKNIAEVEGSDHSQKAREFIKLSSELDSLLESVPTSKLTEFEELVMDAVEKAIPEIKREVDKITRPWTYKPEQFRDDVFRLSEQLGFVVPPAETEVGKAASPVSILNAGVLYKILQASDLYEVFEAKTTMEKMEVKDKINALVLKALELSDVETLMKDILKGEESS